MPSKLPADERQGELWSPEVKERLKDPPVKKGARDKPLSVTQAVRAAMNALETLGVFWIEGEVSSLSRPASGHAYFSLRDDRTGIRAVMWRSDAARLAFPLEDGMRLRCRGRPGIYDRDGMFQFYVQMAEPAGVGSDALALAALRKKLAAEGLFDPSRKRKLPRVPRRIGVVTSKTGAAIRDIIRAVHRRFPIPLLVADTIVQGELAPPQIVAALRAISATDVDVVIVGRGGGSAGDLSAFNDERVVREVARFPVPIISAVGHEIDSSLTDLAADQRAATPTMAGDMVVPVLSELASSLQKGQRRLQREVSFYIHQSRHDLDRMRALLDGRVRAKASTRRDLLQTWLQRLQIQHPNARLVADRAQLDVLLSALHTSARAQLVSLGGRLAVVGHRLDALSPLRVLHRGYAVAMHDGRAVTRADSLAVGAALTLRFARGQVDCAVTKVDTSSEEEPN